MIWYDENTALRNELEREYPAVAEMIADLRAQLEEARAEIDCEERRFNAQQDLLHEVSKEAEALRAEARNLKAACDSTIEANMVLCSQLSRYEQAAEVEGALFPIETVAGVFGPNIPDGMIGQRVRVLVMPEEKEEGL